MLKTFIAPFDFHAPNGGRHRFSEFASLFSERFNTVPQIYDEPIFSYTHYGYSQFDRLRELDESRPAIVYLSNIVMHSALLVLGDCDTSDLISPLQYDSLESFLNEPFSRGFVVDRDKKMSTKFDDTTVVISDLLQFRNDDNELSDDGLFRVLDKIDDIFVSNILDYDRYFAHALVFGDEPFFLNADSNLDYHKCIKQLGEFTLREYLLSQSVPFATLNDDHMDDEYAVSYGMDCWQFNDDSLAFAR